MRDDYAKMEKRIFAKITSSIMEGGDADEQKVNKLREKYRILIS